MEKIMDNVWSLYGENGPFPPCLKRTCFMNYGHQVGSHFEYIAIQTPQPKPGYEYPLGDEGRTFPGEEVGGEDGVDTRSLAVTHRNLAESWASGYK